jgi:hypothetical protein
MLLDLAGQGERSPTAHFEAPPCGSLEDRWNVYASGYLARLAEALGEDYPAIRRVLGPEAFGALAGRYVHAFPPRSFDLGREGDRLPEYLTLDALTRELPFLPDLARLERLVAEAFVAADAEPLAWESLASEEPEEVSRLPLVAVPGAAVLWSRWPVLDLWRTRHQEDGEVSVDLGGRPQTVLVLRQATAVSCAELDGTEAGVADAIVAGGLTISMLEARLAPGGDAAAIASLVAAFRSLVGRGFFCRLRGTDRSNASIY